MYCNGLWLSYRVDDGKRRFFLERKSGTNCRPDFSACGERHGGETRNVYCNGLWLSYRVDDGKRRFFSDRKSGTNCQPDFAACGERHGGEVGTGIATGLPPCRVDCGNAVFFRIGKAGRTVDRIFRLAGRGTEEKRGTCIATVCGCHTALMTENAVFFRIGKAGRTVNRILRLAGRGTEEKSGRVLQRVCHRDG